MDDLIKLVRTRPLTTGLNTHRMSKARKKLKKAAGKSARRPKPSKARFITRTEARRRAEWHVLNRMFKGATVRDGAEAKLCIYSPGKIKSADAWVVYKNPEESALKSAAVVLVSKRTGRVLYEGSAGDEG
jgi:hypothetical protein